MQYCYSASALGSLWQEFSLHIEREISIPASTKETVHVYVRHLKSCRGKCAGKQHRKCSYLYIYGQGKLRRLLTEYVRYFHEDRAHLGLSKVTPNEGVRTLGPGKIISPRLGGLHHRYQRAA